MSYLRWAIDNHHNLVVDVTVIGATHVCLFVTRVWLPSLALIASCTGSLTCQPTRPYKNFITPCYFLKEEGILDNEMNEDFLMEIFWCIKPKSKSTISAESTKKFSLQVNLCQKLLLLHQLTHNMTTDCSLKYKFNTWKFQAQTWGENVVYRNCYWHSEQFLYTTCSPHVLQRFTCDYCVRWNENCIIR